MSAKAPALADFRRIVVKVGSSLLVDAAAGRLKEAWLASLAADIARLHKDKRDIIVVSSGAIALGRSVLKLPKGPLKLEDSQAAAAVGQIALARTWAEVLGKHGITASQVLVTLDDTEERRRYLNARSTIAKLLEWRSRAGDQRERHGRDHRDPLRRQRPARRPRRHHGERRPAGAAVRRRRPLRRAAAPQRQGQAHPAGAAHHRRDRGDGRRGRLRSRPRRHAHQDRGRQDRHHRRHPHGDRLRPRRQSAARDRSRRARTWFLTPGNPVTSRKKWIAGSLEPKGTLTIDAGAVAALRRGKSLLPAGVIRVDGSFARGDAVVIRGPDGAEIGRGLVAYDAEDAAKIVRKSSGDIVLILGIEGRAEMVHRDDMVLGGA